MEQLNNIEGKKVLFLWNSQASQVEMPQYLETLKSKVGTTGSVQFENIDRFSLDNEASSFDVVISGMLKPYTQNHSPGILSMLIKLAKPKGVIIIHQAIAENDTVAKENFPTVDQFKSRLILGGFSNVAEPVLLPLSGEVMKEIQAALSLDATPVVYSIHCEKPNFEIGASSKLSFTSDAADVWKLDASDMNEDDLIDSDELLSSEDLKKPDPASLKVCGTTGKRKACKDCSCGLAEELDAEARGKKQDGGGETVKSSCGSCYLGDAFRCSTCPYLGMPAFKPGEKVSISDLQMRADV